MKKICLLILSISFVFFIDIFTVNAVSLSNKNYTIECIYTDGSLFSNEYSVGRGEFTTNRLSYNLTGTSNRDANSGGDLIFVNSMVSTSSDNTVMTCPTNVYSTTYNEADYYKFRENFVCTDDNCDEFGTSRSGWCKFWGCDETGDAKTAVSQAEKSVLVSERYILGSELPEPNATLYYMMPSEQAAGTNAYIKIMVYDNVVLLEKDGRVTRIMNGSNNFSDITSTGIKDSNGNVIKYEYQNLSDSLKTIYINSPEPIPSTSSSSTITYSFNKGQLGYSVSLAQSSIYKNRYVLTDEILDSNSLDDSLCTERLKNTAPILKDLIKYSQFFLPLIVIIITSIDIGRVVLAGNIEEELPKRRKMIIHRLILVVVFFFLPLFVRIFINLIKDSGVGEGNGLSDSIEYIDCLFE